jgi:tetratricopeptide (TPR) repeat protein
VGTSTVRGPNRRLTRRERDVLAALCAPLSGGTAFVEPASIRDMADALGVSDAAIKQHLLTLYDKFQIPEGEERRRTQLANRVVEAGVITLPHRSAEPGAGTDDGLALAKGAAAMRNWGRAFDQLSSIPPDRIADSADAQELLGEAAIWSGHPEVSTAARQRAYTLHVQAGRAERAAVVALSLVVNHVTRNNLAQASGWLAKAQRHLESSGSTLPRGYLQMTNAIFASYGGDFPAALALTAEAGEIASRAGDADLASMTLAVRGYALCLLGRAGEARPLLDEAMASATSGELGPFATGIVYCRTVCASVDSLDFQRAVEWTDAIERASIDTCTAGFPGDCRAHRASIHVLRGNWSAGLREATAAIAESHSFDIRHAGIAENEVGTVRLRAGDLAGAGAAFQQAHALGHSPEPGRALLHLARGELAEARALIRIAVEAAPGGTALRGRLLPAQIEIALAQADLGGAEAAQRELAAIARASGASLLRAAATNAEGALHMAHGDVRSACDTLRAAVAGWLETGAPYETACARIQLAEALAAQRERMAASLELAAAEPVLRQLGAEPALARGRRVLV